MSLSKHNPDVLEFLANISNQEVFTPVKLANDMLDLLPEELWTNKNIKILDPFTKTGVFLREAAKRLIKGLEKEIPDLTERLNWIYENQLYGIAISELTSLTSRRSLYYSKKADSERSIAQKVFKNRPNGNIHFDLELKHTFKNGICTYCGANEKEYDRDDNQEQYAYWFIHQDNLEKKIKEVFGVEFDVITGNPPYQMSDGGGVGISAKPLYHLFVEKAIELSPKYISMIIPTRYTLGGKGLTTFREKILKDRRIKEFIDFPDAKEIFPSVNIPGGVNYFLWDKNYNGKCKVTTNILNNKDVSVRYLLEDNSEIFIRHNKAIAILEKIKKISLKTIEEEVSLRNPYGLSKVPKSASDEAFENSYKIYGNKVIKFIRKDLISKNLDTIQLHRVLIARLGSVGYQRKLDPIIAKPNEICAETYLSIGKFTDREAENFVSYANTKFFHFLLGLIRITQDTSRKSFSLIPIQDWSKSWTDEELYKKYSLTKDEINFIDSLVWNKNSDEEILEEEDILEDE
jgi:site-specific DNA-methyltransferase (adenine-specific)